MFGALDDAAVWEAVVTRVDRGIDRGVRHIARGVTLGISPARVRERSVGQDATVRRHVRVADVVVSAAAREQRERGDDDDGVEGEARHGDALEKVL